jgi:NADPH:quinone reductase-like Zn-dependent oxidoreductase
MKAIVRNAYGSPDLLELQETDKPDLTDDGVLARVRATSVNPAGWYSLTGTPYVARPQVGLLKPRSNRRYEVSDIADALRYLGEGHARGKIVITL